MDITLNYIEKGKGFPMVLLHGNSEDHGYFEHQIDYFSESYRVIALDTRGHGTSKRGSAAFTLNQFAEDLKCFLDEHNINRCILLGFSDGGNIALIFSMKYPKYVEKLILNGANLKPNGMKINVFRWVWRHYYLAVLKKDKSQKEMMALMLFQPDIKAESLSNIEIPTLIIAGKKDMIKEKHTWLIHKSIKYSTLVILDGTHFIANENPNEFNKAVKTFLEK